MAEKRLIDAMKTTIKLSGRIMPLIQMGANPTHVYNEVIQVVAEAPTVDAVEVVRCRDCRWARTQDHREPTDTPKQLLICQCFMHHYIPAPWGARLAVEPDGFCSYGERRTDG